jgi:3-hydroxy-9,10-secoandrosta-1,3,5(10)-triene-9,17-dione monooxygenase reductase component
MSALPAIDVPVLDQRAFRRAVGRFATGVSFVTAQAGDTPLGLVVSSFASVSLQPPLVSFCRARASLTWRRMRATGRFGINVLAADQADFVSRVAPAGADRFAGVDHAPSAGGVPVLAGAAAFLDCRLEAEHPAGDHSIVVGRVEEARMDGDRAPLVLWASAFRRLYLPPTLATPG